MVRLAAVALIVATTSFVVARDAAPSAASCVAPSTRADGSTPPFECDDTDEPAQAPGPTLFFAVLLVLLVVGGALIAASERRARGD